MSELEEALLCVLRDVTNLAARNHCAHEETYRGGAIWEICSQCGMKWADDEGGKPDDAGKLPDELERAYEILEDYEIQDDEVLDKKLSEVFMSLSKSQKPLDPDAAKILYDNLEDLYEGDHKPHRCSCDLAAVILLRRWSDDSPCPIPRHRRFSAVALG